MMRNRFLLKTIAVFLAVEIFASSLAPSFSWALTAGPTAPEVSSFEPVDTTDIVNMATGDFVYNIPLLEVPGPAGGYPMSLSYHAGIQSNLEASWVGLGWTLNPGSINRSVNGYADDHENVVGVSRDFWEGGSQTTYTIGVAVGPPLGTQVTAGLTFADDTYKGFGVGHFAGVSAGFNYGIANLGMQMDYGVSPYGDTYSSTGINVGIGLSSAIGLSAGIVGDNLTGSVRGTGQASLSAGSLGVSISSDNLKPSLKVGGLTTSVHNSSKGSVSTSGYDYQFTIPINPVFGIRLGTSYTRYWSDETTSVATNGSLFQPAAKLNADDLDSKAYDTYDLLGTSTKSRPESELNGSFLDYDNYNVLAQGLSGTVRPYYYRSYLYRQNKKVKLPSGAFEYRIKSYPLAGNKPAEFRFVNDLSNRFTYDMPAFSASSTGNPLSFSYSDTEATGVDGNSGYNSAKNRLVGSKHVKHYSNMQIQAGEATADGFMNTNALGYVRQSNSQIGGFKITNSSGVTYHYALPVLSFNEYTYSGYKDFAGVDNFNHYKRPANYAYTWLLTAVTGPDFVDKNENGLVDNGDYGYWVAFDYGLWTSMYHWRNPGEGYNKDVDLRYDSFSKGTKELYYLNAIRTATHTALFIKELRKDGKGVTPERSEAVVADNSSHTCCTYRDVGGYEASTAYVGSTSYTLHPTSTLRLNKILLLRNDDLAAFGELADKSTIYKHTISNGVTREYHYGQNVIDVHDVASIQSQLLSSSLKVIDLKFDYSLTPGTPNSFVSEVDVNNTDGAASPSVKEGKLTLKTLTILGKGAAAVMPPMKFKYEIDDFVYGEISNLTGSTINVRFSTYDLPKIAKGDILRVTSGSTFYGVVESIGSDSQARVKLISGQPIAIQFGSSIKFNKTKNPPYNKEFYDLWGMYKSDYQDQGNQNISRMTSPVSSAGVDVWSLREITTSLGSKIAVEYEGDRYSNALKNLSNVLIKDIVPHDLANGLFKVYLYGSPEEYGLVGLTKVGVKFMTRRKGTLYDTAHPNPPQCDGSTIDPIYQWYTHYYIDYGPGNCDCRAPIVSSGVDYIVIDIKNGFWNSTWSPVNGQKINNTPPWHDDDGEAIDNPRYNFEAAQFIGGELLFEKVFSPYGGDLRVKSISLTNTDRTNKTKYQYENGVTSYEPLGFGVPIKTLPMSSSPCLITTEEQEISNYKNDYINRIYSKFKDIFLNAREIPGPGVIYGAVKVSEEWTPFGAQTIPIPGFTEYKFEVFQGSMVKMDRVTNVSIPNLGFVGGMEYNGGLVSGLDTKQVFSNAYCAIKDYTAQVGNLKSVTLYDQMGNKVTETINNYLYDQISSSDFENKLLNEHKNIGVLQETFVDARQIYDEDSDEKQYNVHGIRNQKTVYPSILLGQTSINYKTGVKNVSKTLEFDFYSGQPIRSWYRDGYSNEYTTEIMPAYKVYPELGFGLDGHKNMLSQTASSITYRLSPENLKQSVVNATAETWSKDIPVLNIGSQSVEKIWRKSGTYNWQGDERDLPVDGLYPITAFEPFNFANPSSNSGGWLRQNDITLYDHYSRPLEGKDLNGLYSATKFSNSHEFAFASVSNGGYHDFAYSGAEDALVSNYFGGGVSLGSATVNTNKSFVHTGLRCILLNPSDVGFTYEVSKLSLKNYTSKYQASVWVREIVAGALPPFSLIAETDNQVLLGSAGPNIKYKAGPWYLVNLEFNLPSSTNKIKIYVKNSGSSPVYVDDFRFGPLNASIASYVYNKAGELTHLLDANNLYTEFQYDDYGRLVKVFKENFEHGKSLVNETKYHINPNN